MDAADDTIALRTFSGPNLGAEVLLPPGAYVIGTDSSCDIVLGDSAMAPRHAALTVELPQKGQVTHVHVMPLDGKVFFEDIPLPAEGLNIPPSAAWFLGLTCLAWNLPHAPREEIIPRLPGLAPSSAQQEAAPRQKIVRQEESKKEETGQEKAPHSANTGGIYLPTPLAQPRRWPFRLAALLVLLILGLLTVTYWDALDSTEELAVVLRQQIHEAGLLKVGVTSENERITVSGSVANEKERSLILTLARNLKCPVYIRVGVRDDMAQAVAMKFKANGIFPEVSFPDGGERMRIAAYIHNFPAEKAVFASLDKDLPDLPPIERRIVHADQLQGFIERELDKARIRDVRIAFGQGRIELTDTSSSGHHEALEQAMNRVTENLKMPLVYTIISQDSPPSGSGDKNTSTELQVLVPDGISPDMSTSSTTEKNSLEDIQVSGVVIETGRMGNMPFITFANGQRIFEGGVLPGGYVLETIGLDALILSKNGRTTTYLLRGNNE